MASNFKETHKVTVKGILDLENQTIMLDDGVVISLVNDVLEKFNGCEISMAIGLTNELDK